MAKQSSAQFSALTVDGFNLLAAKVQSVSHEIAFELDPGDGLGDKWREKAPTGMWTATLEQTGAFFTTAANSIHDAMHGLPATKRIVSWATAGNTIGAVFNGAIGAFTAKYAVLSALGKLTKANVTYAVAGQVDEGVILQPQHQETVDWTGASVDHGASSASGGVGYLSVSQMAGLTGFVGTIEGSGDNASWTALGPTFANITAAPAVHRLVFAGAVPRYLRFRGDVTGTGTVTSFVGFART